MLTITKQEIKYILNLHEKYPDMSYREIGRKCKDRFGVIRHHATIKKVINQ